MLSVFFSSLPTFSITASVSVRNIRNIPKVPLTVKPDPNDTLNRSLNGGNTNNFYYNGNNYAKPADELYMNGQAQQAGIPIHQDPLQHQYAVVKKTGSKRDVRENVDRENSAMFKVSSDRSGSSQVKILGIGSWSDAAKFRNINQSLMVVPSQ